MSGASSPTGMERELQSWIDAWKISTEDVLFQVSGHPSKFEVVSEPPAAADTDLRYTIMAGGKVQGEMGLRLAEGAAIRLARKFLGEPVPAPRPEGAGPETISNDDRDALEELLRQIAGLAATAVAPAAGGEVQLQVTRAEAAWPWTAESIVALRTRDEAGNEIAIEIRISPALGVALAPRAADGAATPQTSSEAHPAAASTADFPSAGYRRLHDVGLGVKLRFGTRRMSLRDVLALSSGLVVELDNALNSPVDLLLDGRVIARGEVVVIDGKYGLRVIDVVEPPSGAAPA